MHCVSLQLRLINPVGLKTLALSVVRTYRLSGLRCDLMPKIGWRERQYRFEGKVKAAAEQDRKKRKERRKKRTG